MFDIARAALLIVGVAEDKLPRTHNGVSEAFWIHAVHSGLVDRELAAELSRTESLRIKADYTDLEIEPNIAAEVVEKAELFTKETERAFGLDETSLENEYENHPLEDNGKVSEAGIGDAEKKDAQLEPIFLEEIRRQARENWVHLRQQKIDDARGADPRRGTGAKPEKT